MNDWPGKWSEPQERWITGDWTEVAPGVRVRGVGLPSEEDCAEPVAIEVVTRLADTYATAVTDPAVPR